MHQEQAIALNLARPVSQMETGTSSMKMRRPLVAIELNGLPIELETTMPDAIGPASNQTAEVRLAA